MKKRLLIAFLILPFMGVTGQEKFFSRNGEISFFSKTPLEDIEAHSKDGIGILDASTGEVIARVSIKTFEFEKKLMQEHFNENYLESDKYPRAEFKGSIESFDLSKLIPGEMMEYKVKGKITIHGKTRDLNTLIKLKKDGSVIQASGSFTVLLKDHDIKVPKVVVKNIAEEIDVKMKFDLKKMD